MYKFKSLFLIIRLFIASFYEYFFTGNHLEFADAPAPIPWSEMIKTGAVKDRVDVDVRTKIFTNRPDVGFMTMLLTMLQVEGIKSTKVIGYEERALPDKVQVAAAGGVAAGVAGATRDITLVSGQGDMIEINGLVLLDYEPATGYTNYAKIVARVGDVLTLQPWHTPNTKILGKQAGGTVADGIAHDTKIWLLGGSYPQGSASVDGVTPLTNKFYHVTAIDKTPFSIARSAQNERFYGIPEIDRIRNNAEYRHLLKLEKSLLLNQEMYEKEASSSDKTHEGTPRGIEHWLLNYGGIIEQYNNWSFDILKGWSRDLFDPKIVEGYQSKRLMLANKVMSGYWWQLNEEKRCVITPNKDFGVPGVNHIVFDDGEFDMKVHPILNEKYPDDHYGMALHLNYLEYTPFQTTILQNAIQNNDVDGVKSQYLTEWTYLLYLPELHGIIRKLKT